MAPSACSCITPIIEFAFKGESSHRQLYMSTIRPIGPSHHIPHRAHSL